MIALLDAEELKGGDVRVCREGDMRRGDDWGDRIVSREEENGRGRGEGEDKGSPAKRNAMARRQLALLAWQVIRGAMMQILCNLSRAE